MDFIRQRALIIIALIIAGFVALGIALVPFTKVAMNVIKTDATTQGMDHLGFTVSDLDASTAFFTEAAGFRKVGGNAEYPANFVTDGTMLVTLWQATDPDAAIAFNRKTNVGLHHAAFSIADVETLDELHEKFLAHPDVTIEFAPELMGGGPSKHMIVRDPSGLRLEFTARGGLSRTDSK